MALAAVLLAAFLGVGGCGSAGGLPEAGGCVLERGMDTDQLSRCGCFSAQSQGYDPVPQSPNSGGGAVTRVSVVNYLCPVRPEGLAEVVVVNGVVSEIAD